MFFLILFSLGLAGCNEVSYESNCVSSEPNSSPSIEDNSSSKESITPSVKPSEPSITPSEPSQEPELEKMYITIDDFNQDIDSSVYLISTITGKIKDKFYIEAEDDAFEINDVSSTLFSKCVVGDKVEFELMIQNGEVEIIDIEGNIFKNNQEARITISDGIMKL